MELVARLAVLLSAALTAFAFQAAPTAETGTVAGRVIEAHSGDPAKVIRKALIILRQGQGPGIGAYSDDKGNYRLQAKPGAYSVTVERDGYVDAQSQTRTIQVQAGQTTAVVDLELVRTAAISGRVLDPDGEPARRAGLQLRSVRAKGRAPILGGVTDDRGTYRIFDIPPGKYHLSATYQPPFQQREIQLQMSEGAAEESYLTTYFPESTDAAQAAAIEVAPGADLGGLDFQLRRARAVHVRGHVSGMAAAPLPIAMITLQPVGSDPGNGRDAVVRDLSGVFDLGGVLPGKYELSANAPDLTGGGAGPSAQRTIEVGPTDVEGIQLTLAPPQTVKGRIVLPEDRKMPPGLLVMVSNRARRSGQMSQVRSDGTFTVPAVPVGDYDLEIGSAGPGDDLYVSAIRRGEDDVLALGLAVNGASGEPVEIVLKPNGGTVEVVARTAKGEPLPEANVALLPDPPRRGQVALYGTCVTDARGVCTLRGVAPGPYHAFAVSKDAGIDFRDPASTKELEGISKAVKVAEGDRQSVEIEVSTEEK